MYNKNFDTWNNQKKKIESIDRTQQCHERQVCMCAVGLNVGNEIDGKGELFTLPVLVLKRCNKETFVGIPLTKTYKNNQWYARCTVDGKDGAVNISQIRLFDQKRALRLIETIETVEFEDVKQKVAKALL